VGALTDARVRAVSASGPVDSGAAERNLGQALGRLLAIAKAYPELRATENFQQLQAELSNTEAQISAARRIYNGNVQSYNTKIQIFPNSLLAGMWHFAPRDFFELADAAHREPVTVA
jgi:LemA protein